MAEAALDLGLALARWAGLLGAAGGAGWGLFAPRGRGRVPLLAPLLILAGALCLWPLEAAALSGDPAAAIDPGALRAVLLQTPVGVSILARTACGAALLAFSTAGRRRVRRAAAAVAALGALGFGVLGGHAAAGEGAFGLLRLGAAAAHAMAAGSWVGAVAVFAAGAKSGGVDEVHRLRAFAGVGSLLVVVILLTGLFNLVVIGGGRSVGVLLGGTWGRPLAVKIAAAGAMLLLAGTNRRLLARDPAPPSSLIRRILLLEAALGALALALVSVLGLTAPE